MLCWEFLLQTNAQLVFSLMIFGMRGYAMMAIGQEKCLLVRTFSFLICLLLFVLRVTAVAYVRFQRKNNVEISILFVIQYVLFFLSREKRRCRRVNVDDGRTDDDTDDDKWDDRFFFYFCFFFMFYRCIEWTNAMQFCWFLMRFMYMLIFIFYRR